ncbi:hypothetical protein D9615_005552 [Tricholomella constricta]|uniref:Uncharacterized protein n=1 Tax=Tricholomella constricta TaxID=117010 RepID=A0A8H5HE22_9AGAR|nr:hypothetical protein D9615_005552 [Tricholomella constricta]
MYRIAQPTYSTRFRTASTSLAARRLFRGTPMPAAARPHLKAKTDDSSSEGLGLRSDRPPDSNSKPDPRNQQISDQDWEIRTGRAIYVLQQTLPEFFLAGLITSIDKATGSPRSASTSIPIISANPLDLQPFGNDEIEVIYSPKISLSYTPPVALPAPFPTTLHVEGLPLYLASAVFIRHTLNALYSDLSVDLRKVVVNTPRSSARTIASAEQKPPSQQKRRSRDKSLLVGFSVTGKSRVSGARGEWEVNSTYTFSPNTGLIDKHVVDSIYPAPHQAVYDALRLSLGKVFGLGMEEEGTRARSNGAACSVVSGTNGGSRDEKKH